MAQERYQVVCQGILHIEKVPKKVPTQPMKILNFWDLPYKKVSKSKMGFFKMDTSVRSTKDPDPPGPQQVIALLHCFCK
jgi:hypothetical protein